MGLKSSRLACTSALLTRLRRVWPFEIGAGTLTPVHAYVSLRAQHAPARTYRGRCGVLAYTAACLLLRVYDHITRRMPSCDDRARPCDAPFPVVMVVVSDGQTLYCILLTTCPGRRRR